MNRFIGILFFVSLLAFSFISAKPDRIIRDSSLINVRINTSRLESFKKDKDFIYKKEITESSSLWEKFINWLRNRFNKFSPRLNSTKRIEYFWYFIYFFVAAVIIYVLLKIFKVDFTGLFSKKEKNISITYQELEENIHAVDNIEELIQEAVQHKNYRRAVRLYYLKALKQLSDKQLIEWKSDKTNSDYFYEIPSKGIRKAFTQITLIYDYIWYGDFTINDRIFKEAALQFISFNNQVEQGEKV